MRRSARPSTVRAARRDPVSGTGLAGDRGRAPIVLATRSDGKVRELEALFTAAGHATETLAALGLLADPEEEGIERFSSFAENAEAKARWFAERLPGRVVFAEDSGLVVDALGGAPGVRSKRWSTREGTEPLAGRALDAANNATLAGALRDVPSLSARRARYLCVAILWCDSRVWRGDGSVEGTIALSPRGNGGFGYDPWFVSEELAMTFGEASASEKARVSHRARATHAVLAAAHSALAERALPRA